MTRRIIDNGRTVGLAGYGPPIAWTRNGWWETLTDVARDVKRNYRYYIATDVGQIDVTLANGRVTAAGGSGNILDRLPTDPHDLERLKAQRDALVDLHLQDRRSV